MSISLEILICYNNWDKPYLRLYFYIWNHTTMGKLCVPHEEWSNLGMTDSSVLASTLILRVGYWLESVLPSCTTGNPNFIRCKTNKPNENNTLCNICQTVCQKQFLILFYCELLHILKWKLDMIFGVFQLFGMKWIWLHLSNGLVPIRHSVITWNDVLPKTPDAVIGL